MKSIVLFDGVCNLCNSSVQFILKRDRRERFVFASLQSNKGQEILRRFELPTSNFNSFILVDNGKIYTRSSAALRMLKLLGGGWQFFFAFIIIPPFIRNAIYNLIARNRYKWFGKKESCWIPTPELRERFLE